jgi:hypothetical protein
MEFTPDRHRPLDYSGIPLVAELARVPASAIGDLNSGEFSYELSETV